MPEPIRPRECTREMSETLFTPTKRICIPIERMAYEQILGDQSAFRKYLDGQIAQHPELFPAAIQGGYQLHDILPPSKKLADLRLRRIKVTTAEGKPAVFSVAPSFVMPYMTGYTVDVEKALFLRRFGVPFWALTYVFGHDDMYWERLELRLGHNSLVGTTVKHADHLPADVLADEKHTRLNGDKVYIATTVAAECVLGASVAPQADAEQLEKAYGHFKTEAQNLLADYQPGLMNECPTKPLFDHRNIPFLFHGRYGLEYLVKFCRQITALFCARLQIWHSSTLTTRNKNGINFQPLLDHSFISPLSASHRQHRWLEGYPDGLAAPLSNHHHHRLLSARLSQNPRLLQANEGTLPSHLHARLGHLSCRQLRPLPDEGQRVERMGGTYPQSRGGTGGDSQAL